MRRLMVHPGEKGANRLGHFWWLGYASLGFQFRLNGSSPSECMAV